MICRFNTKWWHWHCLTLGFSIEPRVGWLAPVWSLLCSRFMLSLVRWELGMILVSSWEKEIRVRNLHNRLASVVVVIIFCLQVETFRLIQSWTNMNCVFISSIHHSNSHRAAFLRNLNTVLDTQINTYSHCSQRRSRDCILLQQASSILTLS